MLNIWVGNLGKYNEGELVGGWLCLPKSNEEIDNFLKEVVKLDDEYEEYMINDYETDLLYEVNEYENIRMLNLLAKATEIVRDSEVVEAGIESLEPGNIKEMINVILQEEDIPYYTYDYEGSSLSNLSKEEKYGMTLAEMSGINQYLAERGLSRYFDYEKYGRDEVLSGYVDLYENGYINIFELSQVDLNRYSIDEIETRFR